MKIYMGKYKNWFGKHYFVEKLFWFLSEDMQDKIADKISRKPFDLLNKIRGERKLKVRIDDYDTWSMDHTLAYIILPMLKQLRDTKHGSGYVDDED